MSRRLATLGLAVAAAVSATCGGSGREPSVPPSAPVTRGGATQGFTIEIKLAPIDLLIR